jgi:hypothetical protein
MSLLLQLLLLLRRMMCHGSTEASIVDLNSGAAKTEANIVTTLSGYGSRSVRRLQQPASHLKLFTQSNELGMIVDRAAWPRAMI